MRMIVNVTVPSQGKVASVGTDDLTRELSRWLNEQEQLRGRVHLLEQRGHGQALTDTLLSLAADLAPPGVAALGTGLIAWLRNRTADIRVSIRRQDGTRFELSARRLRGMNPDEIKSLIDKLVDPPSS